MSGCGILTRVAGVVRQDGGSSSASGETAKGTDERSQKFRENMEKWTSDNVTEENAKQYVIVSAHVQ